ncbi:MAG: cyclopropane-fatty-acyl-phospholipid synthase family protein [Pseudomonadales bacterium]|nr:cyclopropane-fatty-acyl-phospholipid synthase family protein [Pseudomonadales bacterium]
MKTLALDYAATASPNKPGWFAKLIKTRFYENFEKIEFGQITFVDGNEVRVCGQGETSDIKIIINDHHFYSSLAFGGAIAAAEAYMQGIWRCEHLTALIQILLRNRHVLEGLEQNIIKKSFFKLMHWANRDTESRSKKNIAAHYDLGNDLFKNFLDPTMTYSAGFFKHDSATMEQASIAKLDRICQKLKLTAADEVIEIGTGWGSFAIHAATNYGCKVTTTTISQEQYNLAKTRIEEAGLTDKVTLLLEDYRNLKGTYDKLVSIEMIEAVGLNFLGHYFSKCSSLLKPDGTMLIQAITIADQHFGYAKKNVDFIQRYIFPGGALPSVTALTTTATNNTDLRLYALEDITPHYALTLTHWRKQFYENIDIIKKLGYDNQFLRMWEYYLCYCEGGFKERAIGCIHAEFHKPLFGTGIESRIDTST